MSCFGNVMMPSAGTRMARDVLLYSTSVLSHVCGSIFVSYVLKCCRTLCVTLLDYVGPDSARSNSNGSTFCFCLLRLGLAARELRLNITKRRYTCVSWTSIQTHLLKEGGRGAVDSANGSKYLTSSSFSAVRKARR